jgi:hypothetical protein
MYRESRPNLERPERWPGEEDHYRSSFQVGDIVRHKYGALGRITAYNNTWSHIKGGRLVHLEPLLAYPGVPMPESSRQAFCHKVSWEDEMTPAQPGDIAAHADHGTPSYHWRYRPANWAVAS